MSRQLQRWLVACFAAARSAHGGDYIVSVDLLSPGEADYAGLPPGVLCIDIFGDWPDDDYWRAGGIRGLTFNGAQLRYAPDPNDPSIPRLFNPGLANRHATCFSNPRARNSNARFTNAAASAAGRYNPTGPSVIATGTEINIAYFDGRAKPEPPFALSGYVGRIALDVLDVPGAPIDIDGWSAGPLADAPPSAVFVFRSEPPAGGQQLPGTVHATFDHPAIYGIDWGVWFVPEPGSLALILAGAGLALARRRLP